MRPALPITKSRARLFAIGPETGPLLLLDHQMAGRLVECDLKIHGVSNE